jgi:drug/metabolite transporter (DMT)-like permease
MTSTPPRPTPPHHQSRHSHADDAQARLLGIVFMAAAWLAFAGIDSSAKYLGGYLAVMQVVFLRYAGAVVYCVGFVVYRGVSRPLVSKVFWLQMMRGLLLASATAINFLGLRYLQLDQTSAIMFAVPLIICALSVPLLGERVGWRRWVAVLVGLVGVIVIVRPGFESFHWSMLMMVGNAFVAAFYFLLTRMVAGHDKDETSLIYTVLVGTVLTLPFAVVEWQPITGETIVPALLIGLFGGIGHHFIIIAHRLAPAPVIAPFSYTSIIWMIALGYILFDQLPDIFTAVGASIVIGSGIFLIFRESRSRNLARSGAVSGSGSEPDR